MTRPRDDGFTLVEALVALLIISLSLAGVFEASRFVGRMDHRLLSTRQAGRADAAFQADLTGRLAPLQPIDAGKLSGDAGMLHYVCSPGSTLQACSLASGPDRQFVYVADSHTLGQWPPAVQPGSPPARLEALLVRDRRGNNVAVIKFPVEHNGNCQFDMISRTCRNEPDSAQAQSQSQSQSQ